MEREVRMHDLTVSVPLWWCSIPPTSALVRWVQRSIFPPLLSTSADDITTQSRSVRPHTYIHTVFANSFTCFYRNCNSIMNRWMRTCPWNNKLCRYHNNNLTVSMEVLLTGTPASSSQLYLLPCLECQGLVSYLHWYSSDEYCDIFGSKTWQLVVQIDCYCCFIVNSVA